MLRMCDVIGKHFNGINGIYVNSLACVRAKVSESECFSIDSDVR